MSLVWEVLVFLNVFIGNGQFWYCPNTLKCTRPCDCDGNEPHRVNFIQRGLKKILRHLVQLNYEWVL